jgi:hypothetical protein
MHFTLSWADLKVKTLEKIRELMGTFIPRQRYKPFFGRTCDSNSVLQGVWITSNIITGWIQQATWGFAKKTVPGSMQTQTLLRIKRPLALATIFFWSAHRFFAKFKAISSQAFRLYNFPVDFLVMSADFAAIATMFKTSVSDNLLCARVHTLLWQAGRATGEKPRCSTSVWRVNDQEGEEREACADLERVSGVCFVVEHAVGSSSPVALETRLVCVCVRGIFGRKIRESEMLVATFLVGLHVFFDEDEVEDHFATSRTKAVE